MSIHKRKNSKNYIAQFMYNGKTYIKSTKTTNKKLALQIEAQFRMEVIQQKGLGIKEGISLVNAIDMYLVLKEDQSNYKSLVGYMKHFTKHITKKINISNITTRDINAIYVEFTKDFKPSYIKNLFLTFNAMMKYADDNGYATPVLKMPVVKVKSDKLRFLSVDEEDRLLHELTPSNRGFIGSHKESIQDAHDLVVCLLDTGCRYGEVIRLGWDSVDLDNKTVTIYRPKVNNESVLCMTDRMTEVLKRRFDDKETEWVFPSQDKKSHRKHPSPCIRKAMDNVGLEDCNVHTMRHTHASRLAMSGVSLQKIGSILGHSSTAMTERYAHLQPNSTARETTDIINLINQR